MKIILPKFLYKSPHPFYSFFGGYIGVIYQIPLVLLDIKCGQVVSMRRLAGFLVIFSAVVGHCVFHSPHQLHSTILGNIPIEVPGSGTGGNLRQEPILSSPSRSFVSCHHLQSLHRFILEPLRIDAYCSSASRSKLTWQLLSSYATLCILSRPAPIFG